jgi:hypothetical protein
MPVYATSAIWLLLTDHSIYALGTIDEQVLYRRWARACLTWPMNRRRGLPPE